MKAGARSFGLGPQLTLPFAGLIAVILGGNALIASQFYITSNETDRLTSANQQLVAVLQLQSNLLSFHRQLDELSRAVDVSRLIPEGESLRESIRNQTKQTRIAIAKLPSSTVDPSFLPTLDSIDLTLSSEIEAILELAKYGDRATIPPRVNRELDPIEIQTGMLVNSISEKSTQELIQGVADKKNIERRILIIVPVTALLTFSIAAYFGWSIAKRLLELRLEERVNERTRIARDLHDTLLQSFNASLLRFQSVANVLPAQPEEAKRRIENAIDHASNAITEGRDKVHELRSGGAGTIDLDRAITDFAAELLGGSISGPELEIQVEGQPRPLNPMVRDEIYRIATEAMRNAARHAKASRIEAQIRYDDGHLRLRIGDNGTGIDAEVLKDEHKAGHWGLRGMRERARLIGATLEIWSQVNTGTEIELNIPAECVYLSPNSSRLSLFSFPRKP
jgi:signal transduction histidine kinase